MALADLIADPVRALRVGIAQSLVGAPRFLYQAGFADESLEPAYDPLHLGPLHLTSSPEVARDMAILGPSPTNPAGGVRLTLTKPTTDAAGDSVALGLAVLSFPRLSVIRVVATFSKPIGPHTTTDAWASAAFVRASEPDPDVESTGQDTKILVTLQAAPNAEAKPSARMNTPGGHAGGTWLSEEVYGTLFPTTAWDPENPSTGIPLDVDAPVVGESVFTLELDIDRAAASGTATLYVRANGPGDVVDPGPPDYIIGFWQSRPFTHPYMAYRAHNGTENQIGAAGANIAIAKGYGPVAVTVQDFRVYGLIRRDILGDAVATRWMPSLVAEVLSSTRKRLLGWAFEGVASDGAGARERR